MKYESFRIHLCQVVNENYKQNIFWYIIKAQNQEMR